MKLIICIKDTGQGINPSIVPNLFTKFSSKSFEGIGLGLFIAKNIIQLTGEGYGLRTIQMEKVLHFSSP